MKQLKNAMAILFSLFILTFYLSIIAVVLVANHIFNTNTSLRHEIFSACNSLFYNAVFTAFQRWFPAPIFVSYDKKFLSAKKTILISNHCSDYDWLVLFALLYKFNMNFSFKLLMKRSLERIPLFGFILRKLGHIFLYRKRSHDVEIITKAIKKVSGNPEYHVVLYPEGTHSGRVALEQAREFAIKSNLMVDGAPFIPKRVLIPRKAGFETIKSILKPTYLGVTNITILMNPYVKHPPEECPPYELFMNQKQVMNQCLMIDFIDRDSVENGRDEFLLRVFKQKDDLVSRYSEIIGSGCIRTEKEFKECLKKIGKKSDGIATIYIRSNYGSILRMVPVLTVIFVLYCIFKD